MAQRFADEILAAVTGEPGPFDSQIAFLSTRGGRFKDLYVMSLDGGDVRRITSADTLNLSPIWAPDHRSIVLTSYRRATRTSSPRARRADVDEALGSARPQPRRPLVAGRKSSRGHSRIPGQLRDRLVEPDGTLRRRLTDHWAIDVSPSWSPDGRQIAFCSSRCGGPQIYVMNADGSALHRVTNVGAYNTSPSWSPKGDRFAYTSRVGGRFQIFTVKTDGTTCTRSPVAAGTTRTPVGHRMVGIWSSAPRVAGRHVFICRTRRVRIRSN